MTHLITLLEVIVPVLKGLSADVVSVLNACEIRVLLYAVRRGGIAQHACA